MPDSDYHELALQAHKLAFLATKATERLAHVIHSSEVVSTAYSFKLRAKSAESLIDKITAKRKKNPKYGVDIATDLIGVRFLALFKEELPGLVQGVLDFIGMQCGPAHGNFVGKDLVDSIEQAIIYIPNRNADPTYIVCANLFASVGFRVVEVSGEFAPTPGNIYISRKSGNEYSSIHVITRFRDGRRTFPVEIQIRTVYEDIWAEIDHRLIYKPTFEGASRGVEANDKFKSIAARYSASLKRHLDACADSSDDLKGLVRGIYEGYAATAGSASTMQSFDIEGYYDLDLSDEARGHLGAFIGQLKKALASDATSDVINATIDDLYKLADSFSGRDSRFANLIRSELALLHYTKSQKYIADGVAVNSTDIQSELDKSIALYSELLLIPEHETNPFLPFRLGNVFFTMLNPEMALNFYREAYQKLQATASTTWLREQDIARLVISDRYAVQLYLRADSRREEMRRHGFVTNHNADLQADFLAAAAVAFEGRAKHLEAGVPPASALWESVDVRTALDANANVIIDSTVNFLRHGGDVAALNAIGLNLEGLRPLAEGLAGVDLPPKPRVELLDTLRNYWSYVGVPERARECAEELLTLFDENPTLREKFRYVSWYADSMLRDAKECLSGG